MGILSGNTKSRTSKKTNQNNPKSKEEPIKEITLT